MDFLAIRYYDATSCAAAVAQDKARHTSHLVASPMTSQGEPYLAGAYRQGGGSGEAVRRYAVGATITVWIDPSQPEKVMVETGLPVRDLALPAGQYMRRVNEDGTVLHRPTQLIWARCAIGQAWTGSACSDEPELMDWAQALNAAAEADLAGQSDWRLPNRNELGAIGETRCQGPAINGAIFPDSPAAHFWTSSPVQADPEAAWKVGFDEGALLPQPVTESGAVRLVRGGRM